MPNIRSFQPELRHRGSCKLRSLPNLNIARSSERQSTIKTTRQNVLSLNTSLSQLFNAISRLRTRVLSVRSSLHSSLTQLIHIPSSLMGSSLHSRHSLIKISVLLHCICETSRKSRTTNTRTRCDMIQSVTVRQNILRESARLIPKVTKIAFHAGYHRAPTVSHSAKRTSNRVLSLRESSANTSSHRVVHHSRTKIRVLERIARSRRSRRHRRLHSRRIIPPPNTSGT